jgi:hypothetical protein
MPTLATWWLGAGREGPRSLARMNLHCFRFQRSVLLLVPVIKEPVALKAAHSPHRCNSPHNGRLRWGGGDWEGSRTHTGKASVRTVTRCVGFPASSNHPTPCRAPRVAAPQAVAHEPLTAWSVQAQAGGHPIPCGAPRASVPPRLFPAEPGAGSHPPQPLLTGGVLLRSCCCRVLSWASRQQAKCGRQPPPPQRQPWVRVAEGSAEALSWCHTTAQLGSTVGQAGKRACPHPPLSSHARRQPSAAGTHCVVKATLALISSSARLDSRDWSGSPSAGPSPFRRLAATMSAKRSRPAAAAPLRRGSREERDGSAVAGARRGCSSCPWAARFVAGSNTFTARGAWSIWGKGNSLLSASAGAARA